MVRSVHRSVFIYCLPIWKYGISIVADCDIGLHVDLYLIDLAQTQMAPSICKLYIIIQPNHGALVILLSDKPTDGTRHISISFD